MSTYIVTGSASGIGAALCQQLSEQGHTIVGVDRQSNNKFTQFTADLSHAQGRSEVVAKLKQYSETDKVNFDGVICCAGLGVTAPNHALITSVNYFGVTELVEGLTPLLIENARSSVVVIGSVAATQQQAVVSELTDAMFAADEAKTSAIASAIPSPHVSYASSKYAVTVWARRYAVEQAKHGMRINVIAPGAVETPLHQASKEDPRFGEAVKNFIAPLGRNGEPSEIAQAAQFLLSDDARFITGSVLFVDGGMDAMLRAEQF